MVTTLGYSSGVGSLAVTFGCKRVQYVVDFVDRVGSEFWKQVEQIGNDETGVT